MKYPLASSTWNSSEINAIQRVIASDKYSMGLEVMEYERKFAEYTSSKYAVMVSSGSAANLIMIASMFFTGDPSKRLNRGDEIIVPAVSWSTTYFPLQQYGLKVKFVDIDRYTLNIDLEKLEKAITEKTRAILAVNLLGNPNDFKKIRSLIKGSNISLLEDNCESLGATYNGQQAGTFGLMGTYSSFFSHHIATMEGGCVVTNDEELYHILLTIRAHGWTRNLPEENLVTGKQSSDLFEEAFKFVLPGYNVRPLEMSGAIGIEQLKKLPKFIDQRRINADHFKKTLASISTITIQKEISCSSWFGFSLVLDHDCPVSRRDLVKIFEAKNIECRPIVTGNFLKNTKVLSYFDYEVAGTLEAADDIECNGLFVGNHQVDITAEIDYLGDVLSSASSKFFGVK